MAAVHPFQPPGFFTTADLKLSWLPSRSPLPFAALPSVSLPPAAPLAGDTNNRKKSPTEQNKAQVYSAYHPCHPCHSCYPCYSRFHFSSTDDERLAAGQ